MSIRFLHTADWHLGRLFHGVHLTEDQAHVLDQLVGIAKDFNPAAVLVAGDVYDRAIPPPEAVELLDNVLSRIVLGLRIPVVMIAGNHDSPRRLGFGARLLRGQGLYVVGEFTSDTEPVAVFEEEAASGGGTGPVRVCAVPYAEPAVVRERLGGEDQDLVSTIHDHNSAMAATLDRIRAARPEKGHSLLLAHAFVAGGSTSESERPLSVGGADQVDPACFDGFAYVALGHLHRPQSAGGNRIQYSGSLLKYSFTEADQPKSVTRVEMNNDGSCRVERVALNPRRDVRCIEGEMADLLNRPATGAGRDDYLMVTLLDKGPVLDAMGRLREVYPNVLHLERPFITGEAVGRRATADHRKLSDVDLFQSFFESVAGEPLSEAERKEFEGLVERLHRERREAAG